jgi:hypothetical protein
MKKHKMLIAIFGAVVFLTACGSKTDANAKNFGVAMTEYFDAHGKLCLESRSWPVDISESDLFSNSSDSKQMAALQAAGLVKSEEVIVEKALGLSNTGPKKNFKIQRYTLTEAAKPFSQNVIYKNRFKGDTPEKQTRLCWGKKSLDKIVKWEGPMKFGDYQEVTVVYTYKLSNIAEWANNTDIQAAFPTIKSIISGAEKQTTRHGLKLTNQGWEARGL